MTIYDITVTPLGRGLYSARIGERILVERSREPFLAAARVLLQEGLCDDDDVIVMRYSDSGLIALRGRVAVLGELTVIENEAGGPRFAPFKPFMPDRMPIPDNPSGRRAAFVGDPVLDTL